MSNLIKPQVIDNLADSFSELKIKYDDAKFRIDEVVILLQKLKKQKAALLVAKGLLDAILAKIRGYYGNTIDETQQLKGGAGNWLPFRKP